MADNDTSKTKNILIIPLSVMNSWNGIQKSTYTVKGSTATISTDGYQQEPVVTYLREKYGLDYIVIINTSRTMEAPGTPILMKDENGKEYDKCEVSEFEYFKNFITNKFHIPYKDYCIAKDDQAEQKDIDAVIAILKEIIAEFPQNEEHKIRIFMDIHGGLRSNAEMLLTLFSVLPLEDLAPNDDSTQKGHRISINAEDIYSVSYGSDKKEIYVADEIYNLMDLAAGIHEFVDYGRADSLEKYAKNHPEIKNISSAMKRIADALAMGDVSTFDEGIQTLKGCLDDAEAEAKQIDGTNDSQDAEIQKETTELLIRLVRQEYRKILDATDERPRIIWSRDKQFYQLAMTMCEAKMIPFLQREHVLNLREIEGTADAFTRERRINYFLMHYEKRRVNDHAYLYCLEKPKRDLYRDDADKSFFIYCDKQYSDSLDKFLDVHKKIKRTRNKANHADEEWTDDVYKSVDDLNKAIQNYIDAVDALLGTEQNPGAHLVMYSLRQGEGYAVFRSRFANVEDSISEDEYSQIKNAIWPADLAEDILRLANHLKTRPNISANNAPALVNPKLMNLYNAICAAACKQTIADRVEAVRNYDTTTLVILFKDNNADRTDSQWLESALKDKKKPATAFWKKIGNRLGTQVSNQALLAYLSDPNT